MAASDPGGNVIHTVMLAGTDAVGDRTAAGLPTKRSLRARGGIRELGADFAKDTLEVVAKRRTALFAQLKEANKRARGGDDTPRDINHRKRLRHSMYAASIRLANLKHDMHVRVSANIYSVADTFILPHFKVGDIVRLKMHPVAKQRLLSLGHGKQRAFLRHRAMVLGKKLRIVREDYTTQVCPHCMRLNKHVGTKRVFKCPFGNCGFK